MSDRSRWVDCLDPFGRDRAVAVLVEQDRVLLVAPPGEAAVLSPQQTRRLHSALVEAAVRAVDAVPADARRSTSDLLAPHPADTGTLA